MIKNFALIIILLILVAKAQGQNFLNPDLNGIITGVSSLPTSWQNVPFTDINCQATSSSRDSPDLTDLFGPSSATGVAGNPYSGNTFISGGRSTYSMGEFHEGIMQTVTGFIPGNVYTINFQQAVVKQIVCLDPSGSWEVYIDNNLLGITLSTFSNAPYNSSSFIWESRSLSFTAAAISHTIKFLPHDDDLNLTLSTTDTLGALRMGIDSIYIISCNLPPLGNDTTLCQGETLTLQATTPNATYLWQDNSTNPTFNVTQQGTYWAEVTVNNCTITDSISINYNPLPTVDLGNDTSLCQYEILTLNATTPNATYLWQDNSTNPTFNAPQQGTYWTEVTVNNCSSTDVIVISEKACEIILELPNVFTPNNDGSNDLFVPIISKGIVYMHIIIYNRWGNKTFESNKSLIEWSGQDVSEGTYFWVVDYTDINGVENILKGYVTILK